MNDAARPRNRETSHSGHRNAGALASSMWLAARNVTAAPDTRWAVAIALDIVDRAAGPTANAGSASRFQIAISAAEWGLLFCHRGQLSQIRITDVPFVQDRDEHALLRHVPPLRGVGALIQRLEQKHGLAFRRSHAFVGTDLAGAEPRIRSWIASSL